MKVRPRIWPIDPATDDRYTVWPLDPIRPGDEFVMSFGGSTVFNPCLMKTDRRIHQPGTSDLRWALTRGLHTVIAGARGEVKSADGDAHRYRGFAEQLFTVTCTKNRFPFR
jgi:hypothetical protein